MTDTAFRTTDDFVARHEGLVRSIARAVHQRLPACVELDDLVQAGMLGLVQARARFDPARGARFSTFAYYRVRGAILDDLRRMTWLPATVFRRLRELELRDAAFEADPPGARTPWSDPQLAQRFRTSVVRAATVHLLTDLDPTAAAGAEPADPDGTAAEKAARTERIARLREALDQLPPTQAEILRLLYFEGLSMSAVGRRIGRDKSSVCRAHARALGALAGRLAR